MAEKSFGRGTQAKLPLQSKGRIFEIFRLMSGKNIYYLNH